MTDPIRSTSAPGCARALHLWAPGVDRTRGGIQTYAADLLQALRTLCPGTRCEVLLKNEPSPPASEAAGGNLTIRGFGRLPRVPRTPAYAAGLAACTLLRRPDLVISGHLHFAPAARMLNRLLGVPYWVVVYGMEAWDVTRPALRRALRDAELVVSISHHTRDRLLREQRLDPGRVVVLPCTVDAEAFRPAPRPAALLRRHGLDPGQPVILTVARLAGTERYKGYDQVLEALPRIRRAIPDVRYVLVGEGDDRPRIERRIRELGLEGCVTLAGFVPDAELADYYNLCDVFAMPSAREGFGIVYLEALACGKPTLGGNGDGARDALRDGELGVLADPHDVPALARTLIAMLEGSHPHPLLYDPPELRRRVVDAFGFVPFRRRLARIMREHPPRPRAGAPSSER